MARAGKADVIRSGQVSPEVSDRLGQAACMKPEREGSSEPAGAEKCPVTKPSMAVGRDAPAPDSQTLYGARKAGLTGIYPQGTDEIKQWQSPVGSGEAVPSAARKTLLPSHLQPT